MPELIRPFAEWSAAIIELIGVGVIVTISVHGIAVAVWRLARRESFEDVVADTRQRLGKGILIGLEFLIAADIIHTVAVELTIESMTVLAIVVLIRTFLSFTLEAELTGKWPWQQSEPSD